ncbi:uncharacterized protein RCC_05003 [Ramularia collo-cygni]|uniref:2EXR domain-containing protein n=1 Tax=Ramularia collo-cygni TaxID=112498 RepID=A0A2D3V391_9PEZI|nr:uncharacterized protein RCC_05003 [Ramularia collo-cygni]CZT19157.1 uncharacterized protein RCC_05003 [Ramularia collo-cygni]
MEDTSYLARKAQLHELGGRLYFREHWWKLNDQSNRQSDARLTSLGFGFLSTRNFACIRKTSWSRVAYLCTRAQRGMISYDKRLIGDLRQFCKERDFQMFKNLKKKELIELLERKDEEATFPRFMELPPELRIMIYEHSFDTSIDHSGSSQWQEWRASSFYTIPPRVTYASKALRQESLPIFYTGGLLKIRMNVRQATHGFTIKENGFATLFFAKASQATLECVKAIQVTFDCNFQETSASWLSFRDEWIVTITLPTASTPYQITQVSHPSRRYAPVGLPVHQKLLEKSLGEILEGMVSKAKGKRTTFERGDIFEIRRAFQELGDALEKKRVS